MKKLERSLNQCSHSPCVEIMDLVLVADECCMDNNVHEMVDFVFQWTKLHKTFN